ncbi:MAG: DUF551 domain-containing protein [Saccharofermentanales bacterium]
MSETVEWTHEEIESVLRTLSLRKRTDKDFSVGTLMDTLERVDRLLTRAEEAERDLAALREQTRWIPVGERLPEVIEQVLCYAPHYHSIEVRWADQLGEAVTHWRPLPEPPEDE